MIVRISAIILVATAFFIALGVLVPEESQKKIKTFFLSPEQKVLFSECEAARQKLKEQQVPLKFSSIEFKVRDKRLEEDPILNDLKKCFATSEKSPVQLEIELFSSDWNQQSSNDLQVQMSIFDTKTKNKIAEYGFRMDHEPFVTQKK